MRGPAKNIGVVLSGCGVFDGAEIHEATITLLALDQAGVNVVCMAPNVDQMHVIDHGAGEPARGSSRNVLAESARISRGEIRDIATVATSELDGLIFPGGFGAAKNLSNFATDGGNCTVHPQVEKLVQDMNTAGKPLGFMCIAPAIAARSLGRLKPMLTIGNDEGTAAAITEMGATHVNCTVEEIVVDETHKIVSTPAYMLGPSIAPVSRGIHKLVEKVLDLA